MAIDPISMNTMLNIVKTARGWRDAKLAKNRQRVVEIVSEVITPAIEILGRQNAGLSMNRMQGCYPAFYWSHLEHRGNIQRIWTIYLDPRLKLIQRDFIKKYKSLWNRMIFYDTHFVREVELALRATGVAILDTGFKELAGNIIEEWSRDRNTGALVFSDKTILAMLSPIIDNQQSVSSDFVYHEIWQSYGPTFLAFRKSEKVRIALSQLYDISDKTRDFGRELEEDLEKLRDNLQDKHGLSNSEMVPRQRVMIDSE